LETAIPHRTPFGTPSSIGAPDDLEKTPKSASKTAKMNKTPPFGNNPKIFGFISDGAWFYSFLRVLRHDFCSIVSNERFFIQNRVIEACPTPKAEK
jgi:hypothetical protein